MAVEKILPGGWKVTKLADFVNSKKGKKPKFVSTVRTEDFNIPYVNIKAFEKNIVDEYTNGEGCVFCEEGDFLMVWDGSRSGYVGKAIKGAIGSTLVKLSFPKEVFQKFAYYFLQSKYIEINTRAKGVGIPHVDPNLVWNYEFLLPPIEEQQQIVDKIEELFSELDKGIENLKAAQQQLKVYRQAVLKWAFEGRLTNDNVEDGELPTGWKWVELGDLMESVRNGYSKKPDENGSYKILRISSVRPNNINVKDVRYLKDKIGENNEVKENDILFTRYNGSIDFVGVSAIVPRLYESLFYPDKLVRCRPVMRNYYHSAFITYASNSHVSRQFVLSKIKTTAGQTGISGGDIKQIPIPIPTDLKEQKNIVQEIESRLSVCDKIEETIDDSLQQAEALRQSILKKAFEGRLVKVDTQQEAKVISIHAMRDIWERKVLAGKIIFACHKERSFGTTKFQKLLYLCEQHSQLEFDTHYVKQTAGPLDAAFIYPFIREAEKSGWFVQETEIAPFHFEPLNGLGQLTNDYPKFFKSVGDKINFIIGLLKDKNTDDSELVATIYAIWNNYIIQQQVLDAEILINEVYDWSKSKAKFSKQGILAMWKWMKEVGLVPVGFGKLIEK